MSERLLFIYRLKQGVDRTEFEHWLRTEDIPAVRQRPTVLRCESIRIDAVLAGGDSPASYIDILEVTDVAEDQRLAGGPAGERLAEAWLAYVDDYRIVRGDVVDAFVRDIETFE